jgi:hypothetical protein
VPVYACAEFGECTQFPTGGRSERAERMPSCLRCQTYRPVTSLTEDGQLQSAVTV